MQKRNVCIYLAILLLSALGSVAQKQTPPPGGPPNPFTVPPPTSFTLPNGLRVTMVPYGTVPKVTVAAVVRAGNLNEGADQVWLADITGDMIKEGTKTRTAEEVAQQVAGMGGVIDVNVGPDQTRFTADVLSEFGPKLVAVLADVLENPLLPSSELPRLKQDALRKLAIDKTQPQQIATEAFRRTLYPNHPYGRVFPTEDMINKYSVEDVHKFYGDNFGAARTHVYVVGRFDAGAMKQAVTSAFSSWKKGPDPFIDIPKPAMQRSFSLLDRPGAAQTTLYIGLPTAYPGNPDYIPLIVMNSLLGGSFGSRITSNIREQKGYTYSPNSQLSPRYHDAYWLQVADVTTNVTGPSLKDIFYEIQRLQKEPPTEAEMKGIKNYLSGVFVLQNSSRQGIINQLSFVDLHGLGDDYLRTYVQKINAVTPQQVSAMAAKYIKPDEITVVAVGDKQKIAEQVAPYQSVSKTQ
jgi:zinc protease